MHIAEGIKPEKVQYFSNIEESINAVDRGKASYGYGNIHSVLYYTALNNYKNIITVPIDIQPRKLHLGIAGGDKTLLSIINKSISVIDESEIHSIVLEETSRVEPKVTLDMSRYSTEFAVIVFIVLLVLACGIISSIIISERVRKQNRKYESVIANEYIEYFPRDKRWYCQQIWPSKNKEILDIITRALKDALSDNVLVRRTIP